MSDVTAIVEAYADAWNEQDGDARAALIEKAWVPDGRYLDPMLQAEGRDALNDMIEAVHAQYPGHRIRVTSGIDVHHDRVRFAWELVGPDGTLTVAGMDVGVLGAGGQLESITGFFGDLPAAAA
jgi:hypothetical protein